MTTLSVFRAQARPARAAVVARAQKQHVSVPQRLAAASLAAVLSAGAVTDAALAGEFDLLSEPTPTNNYVIDDAGTINKTTKKTVNDRLKRLEIETGYRLEAVTVRRLEVEADAFAFVDRLLDNWYPNKADAENKGVLLIVTAGKDGALSGGSRFVAAVGDEFIDSVIAENIPVFTQEEKYNECLNSSTKRVEAVLTGATDPGGPVRNEAERKRTYKTKEEVNATKTVSTTVVGTLLFISVVVPMLQYYGYTSKD